MNRMGSAKHRLIMNEKIRHRVLFLFLFFWTGIAASQTNWYKGMVHTHTTNSDGELTLEQLVQLYRNLAYQFVFVTDHNVITPCEHLSSSNFLVMRGEEISTDEHWGALNLKTTIDPASLSRQQIIDRINSQDAIPVINHPRWSWIYFTVQDVLALNHIDHMEIFNTITCNYWSHPDYTDLWDEVLSSGRKIYGIATDDYHQTLSEGHNLLNVGWIMVRAAALTKDNILMAIRNGDFYSSTGVTFKELKIENGLITVAVDDNAEIKFIGKNGRVLKKESGYRSSYQLTGDEAYVRVDALTSSGAHGWSQPVYFKSGDATKRLVLESGQNQSSVVNELLGKDLTVRLVNSTSQPIANEKILFQVSSGGGSFNAKDTVSVQTDANGLAKARPRLGRVAGDSNQVFKAMIKNGSGEIIFKASAVAGSAAKLVLISGNHQSAPSSQTLAAPLVVKVLDQYENAKSGPMVEFSIVSGGGTVNERAVSTVLTDQQGLAQVMWKLGSLTNEQQVKAAVPNSTIKEVLFSATATSKPARLTLLSGDGQTGTVAKDLSTPLLVAVSDSFGALISGHPVLFEVTAGAGKINKSTVFTGVTDSTGKVKALWTLGTLAGRQSVTVSSTLDNKKLASTPNPVVITALATASAPSKLLLKEGNSQTGTANHRLTKKLLVQALDGYDNPTAGAKIFFRIKKGHGMVAETQPMTTTADGLASATWILGSTLGSQELEVILDGSQNAPLLFSALAGKSLPSQISIVSGNSQSGILHQALKDTFVVLLKDSTGGPVQGFPIRFVLTAGLGSLLKVNPDTTDSRGQAKMIYRPANQAGLHRVQAVCLATGQFVEFQCTIRVDSSSRPNVHLTDLNRSSYQLDLLTAGGLVYVDGAVTLSVLPDSMNAMYLLKTALGDRENTSETFLTFTLDQSTVLYVAYDQRVAVPPNWLKNNFMPTTKSISLSDRSTSLRIWRRAVSSGKVTWGGNKAVGFSATGDYGMYLVMLPMFFTIDQIPPAVPTGITAVEAE